jgi:hypothetical protein
MREAETRADLYASRGHVLREGLKLVTNRRVRSSTSLVQGGIYKANAYIFSSLLLPTPAQLLNSRPPARPQHANGAADAVLTGAQDHLQSFFSATWLALQPAREGRRVMQYSADGSGDVEDVAERL